MLLEALRWYGAEHEGELPATLADLRPISVPVDPATGRPFEYQLDGDRALISSPDVSGTGRQSFRYEVRFADSAE